VKITLFFENHEKITSFSTDKVVLATCRGLVNSHGLGKKLRKFHFPRIQGGFGFYVFRW